MRTQQRRSREDEATDEAPVAAYASGASEPIDGIARDPASVSAAELMALPPLVAARDPAFRERYPVSIEEYEQLSVEARQPEPMAAAALETMAIVEDPAAAAADTETEAQTQDLPEDAVA